MKLTVMFVIHMTVVLDSLVPVSGQVLMVWGGVSIRHVLSNGM